MARGGFREQAGRPKGATNKLISEAIEKAKETGLLPHEYLLTIVQDESEERAVRIQAAVAAAPYYAPKLASIEQKSELKFNPVINGQAMTLEEWSKQYNADYDADGTDTD